MLFVQFPFVRFLFQLKNSSQFSVQDSVFSWFKSNQLNFITEITFQLTLLSVFSWIWERKVSSFSTKRRLQQKLLKVDLDNILILIQFLCKKFLQYDSNQIDPSQFFFHSTEFCSCTLGCRRFCAIFSYPQKWRKMLGAKAKVNPKALHTQKTLHQLGSRSPFQFYHFPLH